MSEEGRLLITGDPGNGHAGAEELCLTDRLG